MEIILEQRGIDEDMEEVLENISKMTRDIESCRKPIGNLLGTIENLKTNVAYMISY